jgi:hypothetical protein
MATKTATQIEMHVTYNGFHGTRAKAVELAVTPDPRPEWEGWFRGRMTTPDDADFFGCPIKGCLCGDGVPSTLMLRPADLDAGGVYLRESE